jgi:hypothetical protein
MGSESIVMLDRFNIDWRAYMNARLNSFVEFHHYVPDELHILERRGCILTDKRRGELEALYREVAAE